MIVALLIATVVVDCTTTTPGGQHGPIEEVRRLLHHLLHVLLKVLLLQLTNERLLKLGRVRVLLAGVRAELVDRLAVENLLDGASVWERESESEGGMQRNKKVSK